MPPSLPWLICEGAGTSFHLASLSTLTDQIFGCHPCLSSGYNSRPRGNVMLRLRPWLYGAVCSSWPPALPARHHLISHLRATAAAVVRPLVEPVARPQRAQ